MIDNVRVFHSIDDLANDLTGIGNRVRPEMRVVVGETAREGNKIAQGFARRNNGPAKKSTSWKYPGTFSAEMYKNLGLFGNTISAEYGPRHQGQGMLAGILEDGQGLNAPQNNLRRSADIAGDKLALKVNLRVGAWFW